MRSMNDREVLRTPSGTDMIMKVKDGSLKSAI